MQENRIKASRHKGKLTLYGAGELATYHCEILHTSLKFTTGNCNGSLRSDIRIFEESYTGKYIFYSETVSGDPLLEVTGDMGVDLVTTDREK
mgnify:CR=1 FL=1